MGRSLQRVARVATVLAGLAGAYGALYMLGAFGPVSCWTSRSVSSSNRSDNGSGPVTTEVSHGCEAGIDYLFGSTGGNAPVLFSWSLVLLALVAVGSFAAWTGRRGVTWATVVVGAAVTVVGAFSIGWFFLLPTLFLLVAAAARSVAARRASG